jgi:AraC-like DNA-binding protein
MISSNKKTSTDNRSLKVPDPGSVRIGPVAAIPDLLQKHANEPPEQILAEVGLDLRLFADPDNSISFVDVGRLLNLCAKRTGIPHFGLLVGQQAGPASVGQLAELMVHAPDVGTALHSMILHVCLNDRGVVPTLTSEDGVTKLGSAVYIPMHEGIRQIGDASLAIMCNLLRALCGETWAPAEVRFSHTPPRNIKPYESFFRSSLVFEAEENALVFPARWLQQFLPGADIQQHIMTVKRLTTIEAKMGIDFQEQVYSILRPLIVSQTCSSEHLARMLSLHPRTLNRRLQDQGTSYREIVGKLRYEVAKQLLLDTSMPLIKISTMLGYADASVFTRAFRRWSGISPSDWRRQNKQ